MTNKDFEKILDTSDEWIVDRTGIKERHIIAENETTTDMAYQAAINAIKSNSIDVNKIDLIIVATSSPDAIFPATACLLQNRLGLKNIPAFDLAAACSGFVYALTTADCYIKAGMAKTVLVIGVDAVSSMLDYSCRNTSILFGDGAGAVILEATDEEGIIACEIHADGAGANILNCQGHIYNGKIKGHPYIQMDGKGVFKFAVKSLCSVAENVLAKTNYKKEQLNWLIPHQANIRIIEATANFLAMPMDKVIITVDIHGNTSAASVPLALDCAIREDKIKRGDLMMLEGVGAGFTWGAALIRY